MQAQAVPATSTSCCRGDEPVPQRKYSALRGIGITTILFSIISMGINFAVYNSLTNLKLGFFVLYHISAWWIGIPCLIASLVLFAPNSRAPAITTAFFGTIGWILGIIGSAVDGIAATIIASLSTCINKDAVLFGTKTGTSALNAKTCLTAEILFPPIHDVTCVSGTSTTCFFYDGTTNGDFILNNYKNLLNAAVAFDVILTLLVFALAATAYVACCCPSCCGDSDVPLVQARVEVVKGPISKV